MEVKTNPFYELRDRLYAAAAAGCSVIAEDFRLRRALDAFRPLAEKNKAFASLSARCEKLLQAEDPAAEIAGCIALADALAVAQGSFQDDTPTAPVRSLCNVEPMQIYASDFERIQAFQNSFHLPPPPYSKYLADPRVLRQYIKTVIAGNKHSDRVIRLLYRRFGDDILAPVVDAIRTEPPKSAAQMVVYLQILARDRYAPLFAELAQDPDTEEAVRIAAINAMSDLPAQHDTLLKIWQTEKGKIQTAALTALAHQDAPEVQAAFAKKIQKLTSATEKMIGEAGNFVMPYLNVLVGEKILPEMPPKTASECRALLREIAPMLAHKTEADPIFLALTEDLSKLGDLKHYVITGLNRTLMHNVHRFGTDSPYAEQIDRLYAKREEAFSAAKVYLELRRDPAHAVEKLHDTAFSYVEYVMPVLAELFFVSGAGWMLPCGQFDSPAMESDFVFDTFPLDLMKYLRFVAANAKKYGDYDVIQLIVRVSEAHPEDQALMEAVGLITDALLNFRADSRIIPLYAKYYTAQPAEARAGRVLLCWAKNYGQPHRRAVSRYEIAEICRIFPQADMKQAVRLFLMAMERSGDFPPEMIAQQRMNATEYLA